MSDKKNVIDLVVTKGSDGKYHAKGPEDSIFIGTGNSSDEAVGAWFRQNREYANFFVSFIDEDGIFRSSTQYGVARNKDQLGPNELKTLDLLNQKSVHAIICNTSSKEIKLYSTIEKAQNALKEIADERRNKFGVEVTCDELNKFGYTLGWEEHFVLFSIIEMKVE